MRVTLNKLIENIIHLRGLEFGTDIMVGWVNEIEAQAVEQVINHAEGYDLEFAPYEYERDGERMLLIPDQFQDVYINYLFAKIDFNNQETERYNNDVAMLESAWSGYESWHIRTYKQKPLPQFKGY